MSDLVSRLLAAIEQEEQDAPNIHRKDCRSVSYVGVTEGVECDCGKPTVILARCKADRVLVEFWSLAYRRPSDFPGWQWDQVRENAQWTIAKIGLGYGLSAEEETTQ